MKRICKMIFFLMPLVSIAYAQVPTQADLEATVAKWNDFVNPGRVMWTKSASDVFLLSDNLFGDVDKAYELEIARSLSAWPSRSKLSSRANRFA